MKLTVVFIIISSIICKPSPNPNPNPQIGKVGAWALGATAVAGTGAAIGQGIAKNRVRSQANIDRELDNQQIEQLNQVILQQQAKLADQEAQIASLTGGLPPPVAVV